MPDDIEDFLKRAAQRRQTKSSSSTTPSNAAANTTPAKPLATPRPEYTNAKTERVPRNRVENEQPIQAILIEDDNNTGQGVAKHMESLKKQRTKATKVADAKRAGGTVKPIPAAPLASTGAYVVPERAPSIAPQTMTGDNAGFTVSDRLITMLRQPEGMMQAILLQEILNRPEHRW
jgi:hypothetical protein